MEDKSRAYYDRLLSQYIEGTISQEDRFVLEKQALDDPFLYKALEGLQDNKINNNEVIAKLKTKVEQSLSERKSRVFPLLQYGVAASLILLLGAGLWMFNTNITPSETIAMNTEVVSEDRAVELSFENKKETQVSTELEKLEPKSKKVISKNQYDTPKAVISQIDNEENFVKRNEDNNSTIEQSNKDLLPLQQDKSEIINPMLSDTKVGIVQAPPSSNVSAEGSEAELLVIEIEELKTKEGTGEGIVLDDYARDETSKSKRRSTFNAAKASPQHVELDKSEYISSLDKNIIVTPPNGITAFRSILKNLNDTSKQPIGNNNLEVMIEFKLTSQGIPTDLKIITSNMDICGKKAIESIKNSGIWISSPPNSEAVVHLKMPCF